MQFSLDPKKMKGMMSQHGIKQEEIDASEVIIKCPDRNLVINQPSVIKMIMQGQEMFQITGDVEEQTAEKQQYVPSSEDIETVAKKAGVSEKKAKEALINADGDLAKAIIGLK